ncbi:protein phosphatase 2C domain-containing protein [Thermosynechococcus sp. FA-CM-4201]
MLQVYESIEGWLAFTCGVRGSMHDAQQTPCQDALGIVSGWMIDQPYVAAAVADGHGDTKYPFSHIGASLAVQAAIQEFQKFCLTLAKAQQDPESVQNITKTIDPKEQLLELVWQTIQTNQTEDDVQAIIDRLGQLFTNPDILREKLNELSSKTPASSETINTTLRQIDKSFSSDFARLVVRCWRQSIRQENYYSTSTSYKPFGTTLLFAGIINNYLYLSQIGDGSIMILDSTGWHPAFQETTGSNLVGGQTHSLASQNTDKLFQVTQKPLNDVAAIFLSTDGLENSFDSAKDFQDLLQAIIDNLSDYRFTEVADLLQNRLSTYTSQGSGDDIALVGLIRNPLKQQQSSSS